jgi:hypothetical protein
LALEEDANIDNDTLMITDGKESGVRGEEEDVDGRDLVKEKNKREKSDSQNVNSYANSISAGSLEGCPREQ